MRRPTYTCTPYLPRVPCDFTSKVSPTQPSPSWPGRRAVSSFCPIPVHSGPLQPVLTRSNAIRTDFIEVRERACRGRGTYCTARDYRLAGGVGGWMIGLN